MRLRIDEAVCTGHGRCYTLAPDLFDADDRGYGVVTVDEVAESRRPDADSAVQNCPERAITLEAPTPDGT
jgi:ferredoxin